MPRHIWDCPVTIEFHVDDVAGLVRAKLVRNGTVVHEIDTFDRRVNLYENRTEFDKAFWIWRKGLEKRLGEMANRFLESKGATDIVFIPIKKKRKRNRKSRKLH
jgi:hypothetical protein